MARRLARRWGVLEPLQTARSLAGQIRELYVVLKKHADGPVTLVGHSWGAWLAWIFAARYPRMVRKLILVGSGPFEEQYATGIMKTRLRRMGLRDRRRMKALWERLTVPGGPGKNQLMAYLGRIISRVDSWDPMPRKRGEFEADFAVYESVWAEARKLRRSGGLLALGRKIKSPVVALHGDYDPHPRAGVAKPLAGVLKRFRLIRLRQCGHTPWIERKARRKFYALLERELSGD